MSKVYFEYANDNLCVVHSFNNLVGEEVLSARRLIKYFKEEDTPLESNFDESGFNLNSVIRYIRTHVKEIKVYDAIPVDLFKHLMNTDLLNNKKYWISIKKTNYFHMIAIKNDRVFDNEVNNPKGVPYDEWKLNNYKILDVHPVEILKSIPSKRKIH